jgi:deoxyribodipyrimidine photo-lyase
VFRRIGHRTGVPRVFAHQRADFFYLHLLDGDATSNTQGWRWAAGLHTCGKPYLAAAQNIATFTTGRFAPRPRDLAEVTPGTGGDRTG